VLIAGGQGKGADLSPLGSAVSDRLLAAVVIGESAEQLESVFSGRCPVRRAGDMSAAVEMAAKLATSGSTVLLSPACASFDMFTDYVERGEAFIAAVEEGTK
jgi:UDP-N-acetylmuramoylalanine--D-glutamate ligase